VNQFETLDIYKILNYNILQYSKLFWDKNIMLLTKNKTNINRLSFFTHRPVFIIPKSNRIYNLFFSIFNRQSSIINPKGFTVIEVIMVIVILAVLAVIVVPSVGVYYSELQLTNAVQKIVSDIRYVQQAAISKQYIHWVQFNKGQNKYYLWAEDPADPGKANRILLIPGDNTVDISSSFPKVSISSTNIGGAGKNEIEFNSLGNPYDTSGVKLTSNGVVTLSNGATTSKIIITPVGRTYRQ
jgi:prepilin-type N-terminal cleavage/methylation domain-containing protein